MLCRVRKSLMMRFPKCRGVVFQYLPIISRNQVHLHLQKWWAPVITPKKVVYFWTPVAMKGETSANQMRWANDFVRKSPFRVYVSHELPSRILGNAIFTDPWMVDFFWKCRWIYHDHGCYGSGWMMTRSKDSKTPQGSWYQTFCALSLIAIVKPNFEPFW